MNIEHLKIRNFRNIENADLRFSPGYNVLVGANGQGKTNVLESVLFLGTSTSHRTNRERDLIKHGEEVAFVSGEINTGSGPKKIETGLSNDRKLLKIQGKPLTRVGDLYGHLRVVLFAPEDLHIIKGSPRLRRKYLDLAIAQMRPDHVLLLQNYRKVLRQRQLLLREAESLKSIESQLDVWEEQLSRPAGAIVGRRWEIVKKLNELTTRLADELSGGADRLELTYRCSFGDFDPENAEKVCLEKFRNSRQRDFHQKQTSIGPHRDDLSFILQGKELATFGSQGQIRTASLVIRLAEIELIKSEVSEAPVLLIDDVMFEMDTGRRERFFDLLPRDSQGLVTATETSYVEPLIVDSRSVFQVKSGTITAEL